MVWYSERCSKSADERAAPQPPPGPRERQAGDLLRIALEDEIETQLSNFEPRIDVLSITVSNTSEQIDSYELNVIIEFSPINSQQVVTLNVVLERAR